MPDRQSGRVDPRHSQRNQQFYTHANGGERHRLRGRAGRGSAARIRRGEPVHGRERQRCGAEAGHSRPSGVYRASELAGILRTGIDIVTAGDMQFAKELGYSIKLLAVAEREPEGLELHVSPTLVRLGTPLAEVRGAYNAIRVVGDAVGRVFFHGLGAGQMPTASAVVSDIIDTILGRMAITFKTLNLWSDGREALIRPRNPADVLGRFYLRFNVDDRPGVMADIAGILGKHQISIASLIQHENEDESPSVPLVIMTHSAPEGAMQNALQAIGVLASVHPGTVRMRVRD